jgi:ATP-dependent Clp protease ATP-binding subunit ClpB
MIQRHVQDLLAAMILSGEVRDGATLKISAGKAGLTSDGWKATTMDGDALELT